MCCKIATILYIAGYTFDFENNVYVPPLDIEIGKHNTYVAKTRTKKKESWLRLIITMLYKIFICMTILWLVPYTFYMSIRDKNGYTFGRSWFQILIILQYYYAISYFNENHFYENILCSEKLKKYMAYASPCLLMISLALGIINVSLLNYGFRYIGYDELFIKASLVQKVFLSILMLLDSFYTYITFLINSYVFVINMMHHKNTVTSYSEALEQYIKNSMNVVKKINIVAVEFSQMNFMFDKTVELLTPFFSVLNFVGFITIYFYLNAIQNNDIGISEMINMVLFGIVEIIYVYSIQVVNSKIENISDSITSNSMITTFFGNKKMDSSFPLFDKPHNWSSEIQSQRDTRGDVSIQVSEQHNDTTTSTKENKTQSPMKYDKISDATNIMEKQIMIAAVSTEQMLDWLILGNIVSRKWKTFTVFGVELTDTTILSRLVGIAVSILVTTQVGRLLQWWS